MNMITKICAMCKKQIQEENVDVFTTGDNPKTTLCQECFDYIYDSLCHRKEYNQGDLED